MSFVVIGAFARVVHGTRELTNGIDVTPLIRDENLDRLKRALDDLDDARPADGKKLDLAKLPDRVVELETRAGQLKLVAEPAGTRGGNRSAAAYVPKSPLPTISPACSEPSTATKTSHASSASAA